MQSRNFWLSREVILGLAFGLLLAVPVFVFGGSQTIYVDKNASGSENGTAANPYHTLSKALKNADGGTEVSIKNGTYKENITIPKGVDVVGDSRNAIKVLLKGITMINRP